MALEVEAQAPPEVDLQLGEVDDVLEEVEGVVVRRVEGGQRARAWQGKGLCIDEEELTLANHECRRGDVNTAKKHLPCLSKVKYRWNNSGTIANVMGRMQAQFHSYNKRSHRRECTRVPVAV